MKIFASLFLVHRRENFSLGRDVERTADDVISQSLAERDEDLVSSWASRKRKIAKAVKLTGKIYLPRPARCSAGDTK